MGAHQGARRTSAGRFAGRAVLRLALAGTMLLAGCMSMLHGSVERPADSEFGFGPRTSAGRHFSATIEPVQPIRVGRMQRMRLLLRDSAGAALDGAAITIDGGMPQHGHGLPTRPRVTGNTPGGTYEVEGMKFNMGGWWEVELHITSAGVTDSVTFHVDL